MSTHVRATVAGALLALGVTACAGTAHPDPDQLTPYRDRITDEARASDEALLARWEARLVALDGAPVDQIRYGVAEGWLIAAHQQYADNDPSWLAAASLDSARAAITRLEEDRAARVGPSGLSSPRRDSAERDLGLSQVGVRMAGANASVVAICRAPWYRTWSDSLLARAHRLMLAPPIVTPPPVVPSAIVSTGQSTQPVAAVGPAPMPTAGEVAVVAHEVHFAVNSWQIGASSQSELNLLAVLLERYPGVLAELKGFADPRGNAEYNLMLSQHRAEAVRDYLVAKGVARGHVLVGYRAIAASSADSSYEKYAHDRIVEVSLVGADGLPITLEAQDRDLQVETGRSKVAPSTRPKVRHRAAPRPVTAPGSASGTAAGATPGTPSGTAPPTQH
jgi:outer membrane protein OmpA-like peptidoglycan-associated protein